MLSIAPRVHSAQGLTTFSGLTFTGFIGTAVFHVGGSSATLEDCTFRDNPGGAIAVDNGTLTVLRSQFNGNGVLGVTIGGALKVEGGQVDVLDSSFSANLALEGGGVYASGGNVRKRPEPTLS